MDGCWDQALHYLMLPEHNRTFSLVAFISIKVHCFSPSPFSLCLCCFSSFVLTLTNLDGLSFARYDHDATRLSACLLPPPFIHPCHCTLAHTQNRRSHWGCVHEECKGTRLVSSMSLSGPQKWPRKWHSRTGIK